MALAILRSSRIPGPAGTLAFTAQLGSNRFYQYVIGNDRVDRAHGLPMLGEPSFTSPLVGPLPEQTLGRAAVVVPAEQFDRDHRCIQLTTYRTKARDGPAVSDIVRVAAARHVSDDVPPPLGFGMSYATELGHESRLFAAPAPWRNATAMSSREVRPMSDAMFFGSILPMIGQIASKILPALTGGAGGGAGSGSGAPGIAGLIGQLVGGVKGVAAAPPGIEQLIKPETLQLILQLLEQLKNPRAADAVKAQALSRGDDGLSHAAIAPALLAALPALMPLLEKVLTPETIKTVLDHGDPTKMVAAVTDGLKELGKLGIDLDRQENEHLRALNPMGVHAPVDDLLKGMGFASSAGAGVVKERGEPAYRRVESVQLTFAGASPVVIHGRSRVCYRHGEDLAFPFDVKTPKVIRGATLTLLVKNASTRAILVRKSLTVPDVAEGKLPVRAALSRNDLKALKAGDEYMVCAYLVWKNTAGKVIGTSRMQIITLVGEYVFDRVEEGKVVALNDVAKFRPFWHKVWQGTFSREEFKYDFEGKYYYTLDVAATGNAPIETTTSFANDGDKVKHGRLSSGMRTTLASLNALIPLISTAAPLPAAKLDALTSSDFVTRFSTAARFRAALSGRSGVSAALWIYPEVTLHEVVLLKAASTDVDSHVRELVEERVNFPIPVTVHVIGARTTR